MERGNMAVVLLQVGLMLWLKEKLEMLLRTSASLLAHTLRTHPGNDRSSHLAGVNLTQSMDLVC